MRGSINSRAVAPESIEYSMTINLPLEDWITFLNQIDKMEGNSSYPAWHINKAVRECISHAKEHFSKEIKSE